MMVHDSTDSTKHDSRSSKNKTGLQDRKMKL